MSATTDLIRALRRTGLSQSEIARRSGIPQPRISRWEAGGAPAAADDGLRLRELLAAREREGASAIPQEEPATHG